MQTPPCGGGGGRKGERKLKDKGEEEGEGQGQGQGGRRWFSKRLKPGQRRFRDFKR